MREIVSLQVGNCGNAIGQQVMQIFNNFRSFLSTFISSSGKPSPTSTTSTTAVTSSATTFFHTNDSTSSTRADRAMFSCLERFSAISNRRHWAKSNVANTDESSTPTTSCLVNEELATIGREDITQKAPNSTIACWTSRESRRRLATV